MQNLKWILILLVGMSLGTITAQETLKEGTLKYEITNATSDNPQLEAQMGMMEGSSITVFVMGDKQLTKMNMMNGMMQQRMLKNKDDKNVEVYIEMMGRKIKTVMDPSKHQNSEEDTETNIEYFPDDRKEIAGYDAYKAVIKNKVGSQEMMMTAYITEDLKMDAKVIQDVEGTEQLKGLPLEYTIENPQVSLTYTATDISKEVDASEFDFDKTGYEEMSPEELQQMGGGGF